MQIYRRLPSFSDDARKEFILIAFLSWPARRVGNEVYYVARLGISGCGGWICARIGAIGGSPVRCEESPRRAHVATSRAFGLASSVKCAKQREGVIVVVFRCEIARLKAAPSPDHPPAQSAAPPACRRSIFFEIWVWLKSHDCRHRQPKKKVRRRARHLRLCASLRLQ